MLALVNTLAGLALSTFAMLWSPATAAFADPQLAAEPGFAPDSWVVSGRGFEPFQELYVNQIPCGELPCGAGPMVGFQEVTADAHGEFVVQMQLLVDFEPFRGHTDRLIAAYGRNWTEDQITDAPRVRVPLHHPGSPRPPGVGTSPLAAGGARSVDWITAAGEGLLLFSVLSWVCSRRPMRD